MFNCRFKGCQTNGKLSAGGVAGYAEPFQIKLDNRVLLMPVEQTIRTADIFKSSRPSTAGISHSAVLHVPGRNAHLLQSSAKVSRISQAIARSPITAVNEKHDWMRSSAFRQTHINKLVVILSIRNAHVRIRRFLAQNGFALHCAAV